jgi:DNA-binding PadR family transcriptional regulator
VTRGAEDLPGLSLAEWAVLAVLCERDTHGWMLVRVLDQDGELGAVWTVRRALVYRSLEALEHRALITRAGSEASSRGPERTIFAPTRAGRAAVRRWLGEPVVHVRDLRSELLLKLVLGERAGADQRVMLERQRALLEEIEEPLAVRCAQTDGADRALLAFRLETTRAALRFVEGEIEHEGRPTGSEDGLRRGMAD